MSMNSRLIKKMIAYGYINTLSLVALGSKEHSPEDHTQMLS